MTTTVGATTRTLVLSSLGLLALAGRLHAQQPDDRMTAAPLPAYIAVSSEGVVTVTPDRATVQLSVVTRAPTAREAGTMNAQHQRNVLDALAALGIPKEQISTSGYTLQPEMRYVQNRTPEVTGYTASNTVTVELKSIDQVGGAIDAALAHGANQVAGLSFSYSGAEEARRQAITKAVERARLDAEAAARGAGQTLGRLWSIDVGTALSPPPIRYELSMAKTAMAPPVTSPVEAGTQDVRVTVSARWLVR